MDIQQMAMRLEQLEQAMPQLIAEERRANESRLRQEGAIMAIRQMIQAAQAAQTHSHEHGGGE